MSEQGEISVANIANFENSPKFVIMKGEGGQKLFIMNGKMNNELIKDIYEEFSKPKIVNCEKELKSNNDVLNSNSQPVNNISVVNEPDNQTNVSDNSVGKEVTVSVTLKLKNYKNSKSTENENAQITDHYKASNASNTDAVVSCTETNVTNVNQNNSFVAKQGYEVATASNINTLVTISGNKDEKSDTDSLKYKFNENKGKDPGKKGSLVAKQETADASQNESLLGKQENADTNKNSSLFSTQDNTKPNKSDSLVVKQETTDISKNESLLDKHENEYAIKSDFAVTKQKNKSTEAINNCSLVTVDQEEICSPNETTKCSAKVNVFLPNEINVKSLSECHGHATNETTEIEHMLQTTTSILQEKVKQHLDNKVIITNITGHDKKNSQDFVSFLPTTSKCDTTSAKKGHSVLSNETIKTTKLDKACAEVSSFINCDSGQKTNLSEMSSVKSINNAPVVERGTFAIGIEPNISPESVSPQFHETSNNNSNIVSSSGSASDKIRETLKCEALVGDKSLSLKTSTGQEESAPANTNVVNISKAESAPVLESSTRLVTTKDDEISFKPITGNMTNTNEENVNIDIVENTKTNAKIESKIDTGSVNVNVNDSLPNEFEATSINISPFNEVKRDDDKIANDNLKPNQLDAPGIKILSPESLISLEPNCTCNRSGGNEKKEIEKVDESLEKLNVSNEKTVATFQTNYPKSSNEIIDNKEVTSCQSIVKETISNVINSINLASDKPTANDKNLKNEPTTSPNEKTAPQVVKNENVTHVSSPEISDIKIQHQRNGMKIDESLMKKISDSLINLFVETTNNNKEFDPTSVKEGALKGFLKLYGKELVAQEERYQRQVDDLSKKLAEKQQEAKDLSEALKEAKKATLKKDLSEQQRYEIQIDQLKTKIREEETKTESVRVELQYARNEIEFSQAKMRRLEEDLTKANELTESLREQNATRSRDAIRLKELEDQVKSLEDKLRKSECSRKDLETSLAEIETERDEEMKIVQDALDEAAEERQELITSFKKELELLNTTNTAREQQMLEDFEWKLHEMEKEYKSKLEDNNRQAEERLRTMRFMVESELSETLTTVIEERKSADEKLMEVGHLKSYEAEVIQLRGVTHEFQKALRASAREMENGKLRERLLNDEIRGLKMMGAQSRQNSLQRVKRHTDEEEVRQKLEKQRNEINAEWEDKLRKECSRLKTELDDLHSEEKHLAVESMKVQKEQDIQRHRKSWEQRHDEMATQVSSLKDSLVDKDAYYHRELDNQRTMTDRDLWDLRMKLQKLNESSYDQKQQLEEKYREDMERLRIDFEERIKELETRLAICDAQKGVDLIGQMEKEHKTQMQHVGEQHQLSMERLREELEAEKFQAVEDTRLIITNHHVDIENNVKEQLAQAQTNESQIRDELEAIRSSLQCREESLRNLEEELERYKELKNDSSYSSTASSLPPATSTTSSGFSSSQFSLASNDSQGSRNSQDRYSYRDSISLAEGQDDSQRNTGLLGKVFGGGWFTPTKAYSRRGSTPLSYKKPYS